MRIFNLLLMGLIYFNLLLTPTGSAAQMRFVDGFDVVNTAVWKIANYDGTHPLFDTDWRRANVNVNNGLTLTLSPKKGGQNKFNGASLRRENVTGFGRYEAIIQPAKGTGLVTGFFTYTGAYYGTQHDEIDIEFLGKDTRKIHLAWFVDGQLRQVDIALGFDAAAAPHKYGFDWQPDRITWFVDDRPIYTITSDQHPIPQTPGYMFANLWAVSKRLQAWAGLPNRQQNARAQILQVAYTPLQNTQMAALDH